MKALVEELKEGASTETGENNECESEDVISFDGESTVLAINSDNSDIETSDMGETSPKLLLDTDDTTVTEYNNSKASENKQETDCHTNETTSLSGATKPHATSKETIQLNKKSARPSDSKDVPTNISETIKTLHDTLQKLENQYCELMKVTSNVKAIEEECTKFENKFQNIEARLESLESCQTNNIENNDQLLKLREEYENLRDEKRKKEDELSRVQFALDRQNHTLELEKERHKNNLRYQQDETKKLRSDIDRLRDENRKKDDEIRKQRHEITGKEDIINRLKIENEQLREAETRANAPVEIHEDIPLRNRFELTESTNNIENEPEIESLTPAKPNKGIIIIDSIGRNLNGEKITINGAIEYLDKNYGQIDSRTEVVLSIGGNDLADGSVEQTITKYKEIIKLCHEKLPMNPVSILPPIIRLFDRDYSRKQRILLTKLHEEIKSDRVKILENDSIRSREKDQDMFMSDGIHLSHDGTLSLVGIFKTYLNNQFGMAPYSEYKRINENGDYDYNYNDNQSFRQLRPQQRRKPWRSGNIPNYNRQRPGHGPGQFDLKSALADIVSRM